MNKTQKPKDPDISALTSCIRALNRSTSPCMLKANLDFLTDHYLHCPFQEVSKRLWPNDPSSPKHSDSHPMKPRPETKVNTGRSNDRSHGLATYATVIRDGLEVPLIGIPKDGVLDECQCCGEKYPFRELSFSRTGQLLCRKCRD